MSAVEVLRDRAALRAALADLRERPWEPAVRLAIAEAEFRLAVDPRTEHSEGVRGLRAAIEADPFLPKLYLHLGRLLHRAGSHRAALAEYRHAHRLSPSSRRAHLVIALALLELDKEERELGRVLLDALDAGDTDAVSVALGRLDAVVAPSDSKKARKRPKRVTRGAGGSADTWQAVLVEQLGRLEPRGAAARLAVGKDQPAEYLAACVLLLVSGERPDAVRALARTAVARAPGHPAAALLDAALALAEAEGPACFVDVATSLVLDGTVPSELVCWWHHTRFGNGDEDDVLRAVDAYPPHVRDLECFVELRVAVLDDLAQRAWAEGRYPVARVLWREAIAHDPYRVPVAHNLALLAARTKDTAEYQPAWDRLVELLYLRAAGVGDVQLHLVDRRSLHKSLARQSAARHCADTSPRSTPTGDEVSAWIDDQAALDVWLREWDLYYLNARLGFRSPAHVLGVAADASAEALDTARDTLLAHIHAAMGTLGLAGTHAFAEVASTVVRKCHAAAMTRAEDPHHDLEKPLADALADEALRRGIQLRAMTRVLLERNSAEHLVLGARIARGQFALPWASLQPLCAERGLIAEDLDLVAVFESDLVALARMTAEHEPANSVGWDERLDALRECAAVLPHRAELAYLVCLALWTAKRDEEAYDEALAALAPPAFADDDEAVTARTRLVELVSGIGLSGVPKELRSASDVPTAERAVTFARVRLGVFPRSSALRMFLAEVLLELGRITAGRRARDLVDEAVEVLSVGADTAFTAEERVDFATRLATAQGAAAGAVVRERVKALAEPAVERVREIYERHTDDPDGPSAREVRSAVHRSLAELSEALSMAEHAEFADEAARLRAAVVRLREVEQYLDEEQPTTDGG